MPPPPPPAQESEEVDVDGEGILDREEAPPKQEMPQPKGAEHHVKGPRNIEVMATRNGFFDQERKKEGDKFVVPSMKQLGSWMKCLDPKIEEMHLEALRVKRMKANTAVD